MSRHKNLKNIVKDSEYDDAFYDDYDEEYGAEEDGYYQE
jgi:hypothetical protein